MKAKFADTLWSSKKTDYNTPLWLYDKLHSFYHFRTDPATTEDNPLRCKYYFTPLDDGLKFEKWQSTVYINPPYDRKVQALWVYQAKNYNEAQGETVVMLLPARTDTKLWQDFIFPNATFITFIRGRLKFSGHENAAPFGSALVVFHRQAFNFISYQEKKLHNELGRIVRREIVE